MDFWGAIVLVIGIIGFVSRSIVKLVMDTDVRKIEARRSTQASVDVASAAEIERLRAEIAQLRETTTQHALSLQHSVERLDQRVEFVERNTLQSKNGVDSSTQPQQQVLGRS